jgi:cholesterol transport system auxiliary component
MQKITRLLLLGCVLAAGCATRSEPVALYDFGPLRANHADGSNPGGLPPLTVAEINTPAWLDSQLMYFRLSYANEQQTRPYARSRWSMPPLQLFGQRLKARIAQAGGVVLSATDGAASLPVLRLDADEMIQNFDAASHSAAQLSMRASVFNGRSLLAQKTFSQQAIAPSADAAGGARAMAVASDALIDDMMRWLAELPLPKK